MIYYHYYANARSYYLTEAEHNYIQSKMFDENDKRQKEFIVLRDGRLSLDTDSIKSWEIDPESIEQDAREREAEENKKRLKLAMPKENEKEKVERKKKALEKLRQQMIKLGYQKSIKREAGEYRS